MQDQTPNIHLKEPATAPSLRTAARGHAGPVVPSIHLFKRGQTLGFLGRVCVYEISSLQWLGCHQQSVGSQTGAHCPPGLEKALNPESGLCRSEWVGGGSGPWAPATSEAKASDPSKARSRSGKGFPRHKTQGRAGRPDPPARGLLVDEQVT